GRVVVQTAIGHVVGPIAADTHVGEGAAPAAALVGEESSEASVDPVLLDVAHEVRDEVRPAVASRLQLALCAVGLVRESGDETLDALTIHRQGRGVWAARRAVSIATLAARRRAEV